MRILAQWPVDKHQLFERCAPESSALPCVLLRVRIADDLEHHLYSLSRRHSSVVEQLFRKQQVLSSNLSVGSTPPFRARETCYLVDSTVFEPTRRREGPLICEDLLTGRITAPLWRGRVRSPVSSTSTELSIAREDLLSSTQQFFASDVSQARQSGKRFLVVGLAGRPELVVTRR